MALRSVLSNKALILTILLSVASLIGIALIIFQVTGIRGINEEIADVEFDIAQKRVVLERRLEYQANAAQYRQKAELFAQRFPNEPAEDELLRYFNQVADQLGFIIQEVRFDGRVSNDDPSYVRMPMVISFEGSFQDMIKLLDFLEHGNRAFRVDDIRISLTGTPQSAIRVVMSINAFYRGG